MKAKRSRRVNTIMGWLRDQDYPLYGTSYRLVLHAIKPPKRAWFLHYAEGSGWMFSAMYNSYELCVVGTAAELEPVILKRLQRSGISVNTRRLELVPIVDIHEMPRLAAELVAQELER